MTFYKDIGTLSPNGICAPSLPPSVEFLCSNTILVESGGTYSEEQDMGDMYQCPKLDSEILATTAISKD